MSAFFVILNIAALAAVVAVLVVLQRRRVSFSLRVMAGLGLGVLLGGAVKFLFPSEPGVIAGTLGWYDLIGRGYVGFLRMLIVPLILVSIVSAILKLKDAKNLGKISVSVILTLVLTAAAAAAIGAGTALAFRLDARSIQVGQAESGRAEYLEKRSADAKPAIEKMLLDFVPSNPVADMSNARPSSTIALVVFASFLGVAALGLAKKQQEEFAAVKRAADAAYAVTMRLAGMVLKMTPYGVAAIMASTVIKTDYAAIFNLGKFVVASYVALAAVLLMHLAVLALFRLNPLTYLRKAWPVLGFAFTSRTSLGTVPLTIECQNKKLGISDAVANFAATFGTSIGQNGCAGVYPAMLAVMIAPSVGINPLDPLWFAGLLAVTAFSSFGIAGIGGGATFAALMVLSVLDFPLALAGVLISVEPLIDMGRTAINVSDAFVAGAVTGRITGELDLSVYNGKDAELDQIQAG